MTRRMIANGINEKLDMIRLWITVMSHLETRIRYINCRRYYKK